MIKIIYIKIYLVRIVLKMTINTYRQLIGKKIIGIQKIKTDDWFYMNDKNGFYMFIGDDVLNPTILHFHSQNKKNMYSYYTNWKFKQVNEKIEMTSDFKYIGEIITDVWTDGVATNCNDLDYNENDNNLENNTVNPLDTNNIDVDVGKWVAAVGEGEYGPTERKPYTYIKIITALKILHLTTEYHECHYPVTIWDII
jgi:hypothetical protein